MAKVVIGVLGALLVVNMVVGALQREELDRVPSTWHGAWVDFEGLNTISVSENALTRRWDGNVRHCNVQEVVRYYHSPFPFAGYVFGQPSTAITCDVASTRRQQAQSVRGIEALEHYRKTYYFRESSDGWTTVEETEYMSRGWEDSEGVYVWTIGDFLRRR